MKIILLNILALFVFTSTVCSQSISVEPNPAYATADLDNLSTHPEDIVAEAAFINNTSDTINVMWERILVDLPENWASSVDDHFISMPPFVDSHTLSLFPNQVGTLNVHAYPGGGPGGIFENDVYPGEGEVHLKVTNLDDLSDTLIAVYFFTLTGSPILDFSEPELKAIHIFPNPAGDYFTLTKTNEIQSLIIYNILGYEVKTFDVSANRRFEIYDLPSGSYFINLVDKDQKTIKTLRLQKH